MTALICPRCRHANPQDAYFCHRDGVLLEDVKEAQKVKSEFQPPFVFKSGLICKDFKSLGLGILEEWDNAREMLAFAEWEAFFIGLGRHDLAQIASQARLFPDPDRGLDQMIAALPGFDAKPGILRINQKNLDFGTITIGTTEKRTIILENDGDRLVWGEAILTDTPWCSLSPEGPLANRSFQFIKSMSLDIQISSNNIRRSGHTLTGSLIIKTDSGEAAIQLIAKEPEVIPFEGDLFSGATTPRQIAEKSRLKPREAAPLFLSGEVAKWYRANGWSYPVTGPTAPGMASVQQYFEAHGFAPAPKVEIEPPAIYLQTIPGEPVKQSVILRTIEKRHVFGYLMPTEVWIHVGELEPSYQTATIPVEFQTTDLSHGAPLRTLLTVIANGQQRFEIPVEIQAIANTIPLLDLESISSHMDEDESIECAPVELLEGESLEESNLIEAAIVNSLITPSNKVINLDSSITPDSQPVKSNPVQTPNSPFSPKDSNLPDLPLDSNKQSTKLPVNNEQSTSINTVTTYSSINTDKQNNQSFKNSYKNRVKLIIMSGICTGTVLIAIIGLIFVLGAGNKSAGKQLVRPMSAGKPSSDLMGFTIETTDQDQTSLLATEAADTGSHFMLKSGNSTASVNSKKSSSRTITKWETKDGWAHREVEMSLGVNKWRVGQWLRTMPESPNQCAVLFELSPTERDLKIAARLAIRPTTGTGNSVNLFLPNSDSPIKKPTLLRGDKFPDRLFYSIESPPINCMIGFELQDILLPGKEKPSVPSRPAQILVAHGIDSFVQWDCQFPELFDESTETSSSGAKFDQAKAGASASVFKDPFISIYWDEATVRKGQKRIIGFTLGLANQENVK